MHINSKLTVTGATVLTCSLRASSLRSPPRRAARTTLKV